MSKECFGVNDGHTLKGIGSGAVGKINESEHTRKVGGELRRLLKAEGQVVHNCTVDKANSVNESLDLVVQQANRKELDWFISIHFNAGGGEGVEVYTYEGRQYQDAIDVCKNIAALGFRNRGVKKGTGLYVIRKTKAKSMLVEVCFVDTKDADKYLKVGYKAIAKAIAEGILGRKIKDNSGSSTTKPPSNTNTNFKVGDRVKITGSKYATGEMVSDWAKKQTHTISKIQGDRALLKEITSWCYLKDLQISTSSKKLEVGMYVQMIGSKWATGQSVPSWVKNNKYKVKEIKGDRALLDNVVSWAYIKDLKY